MSRRAFGFTQSKLWLVILPKLLMDVSPQEPLKQEGKHHMKQSPATASTPPTRLFDWQAAEGAGRALKTEVRADLKAVLRRETSPQVFIYV